MTAPYKVIAFTQRRLSGFALETSRYVFFCYVFIWFLIIHQGHERKEINLCLAALIDPLHEN